ncbi:FMRFamide receptor [Aphelenchoides bicaudatus]|nr:FMRFamide receptor [Aphelenchoides bicaudatus]
MSLAECMNKSLCREIRISQQIPEVWAVPFYGWAMPIIVAITVLTNSFIVLVLSHKYLRTPTNTILLAMAVTELLTGLSCLPWLIFYYSMGGYKTDHIYGLPAFWCSVYPYFATIFPSIFHTAAIWLTVYLAAQRCIYICMPKLVRNHCTIKRSKQAIVVICIASIWLFAPELFATYNQTFYTEHPTFNVTRRVCVRVKTAFIQYVGSDIYYYLLFGLHTLIAHTLPCILLVCFTWKLIAAIRQADKRYANLISRSETLRKYTLESTEAFITDRSIKRDTIRKRTSFSESKRVQGLKQNTRMLIAVIFLFLITEIPAALIFSIHVSAVALQIGMSNQFREVVKQMLTQRVFFPCGKRAQNLMRNINNHHSPLNPQNNSNTNEPNAPTTKQTIVRDQRSHTSDDRKYSAVEF